MQFSSLVRLDRTLIRGSLSVDNVQIVCYRVFKIVVL
jgi:hypothetical protein